MESEEILREVKNSINVMRIHPDEGGLYEYHFEKIEWLIGRLTNIIRIEEHNGKR